MNDLISRQDAIDAAIEAVDEWDGGYNHTRSDMIADAINNTVPSAQSDIKQAAKLLSDFIESCPGGDSYLITPDGEELRTDWGYAIEGIQLIHDWAERRTDE